MAAKKRTPQRVRYRARIESLLVLSSGGSEDLSDKIEQQAHWAKYMCVLASGYLEVSVKEILLEYSGEKSIPIVARYVEKSWPKSRNMSCENIQSILEKFSKEWEEDFTGWLSKGTERKAQINNLISWRNGISHGNEANTNGVTLASVKDNFACACQLVDHLESSVLS